MSGTILTEVEKDREASCRTLACPNCHAKPRILCSHGRSRAGHQLKSSISHTGRYLAAVDAGLVPEFAGGWHG